MRRRRDRPSLVATATAEVQTKALVATTTTEVPMDESTLVATSVEVPMDESTLVATAAKVRKILSIEPITTTEVPIVTTRPEMPMDK